MKARFIQLGKTKRKLRIWNQGDVDAKNVQIECLAGEQFINWADVRNKFPIESLGSDQFVEVSGRMLQTLDRKITIKVVWFDDSNNSNSEIIYLTV